MKRVLILVLALTLLFGTLSASAVPPGHAKRVMNENEEAWYGPFGILPPGLMGKFIPPGLWKKGFDLPPGLSDRLDEDLPPGIMMRFRQAQQWEYEGGPVKEVNRFEAEDYDTLLEILEDDDYMDENIVIRLMDNIELEDPLVIEGERRVRINGEAKVLTLDEDEFDESDWMIFVEDGAELVLNNVKLDGALDEDDEDDHLEGLVRVEEGGKLSFIGKSDFSNAISAFGYEMDKDDFEELDVDAFATYLANRGDFTNIDFYLKIYDADDLDEILFDLDVD